MDSNLTKSALLTTSASTDVGRSGGVVSITDLLPFDIDKMLAANQRIYRAEVQQVITVDLGTVALAANTRYSIKIGNVLNEYEGGQVALKTYAWTSGSVAPGALTTIADGIVAAINNTAVNNYVSAVRAANTIVITDDAGYYPIRPAGRAGPSTVLIVDTAGVMSGSTNTVTTAGVVGYGVGTYILSNVPVKDPMTGNLTSGELDTPTGAVAGQFYDGFIVTYAKEVNHQAVSGLRAEKVLRQLIYVDNGTGASVANLAGYVAFLREFERLIYHNYTKDSNSTVSFIDTAPSFSGETNSGVPTGTGGDVNTVHFQDGQIDYSVIATQTILCPTWTTTGLNIMQDLTANDGTEYSASVQAIGPVEYVVGQDVCSFRVTTAAGDITDANPIGIGLRAKAVMGADFTAYTDFAAFAIEDAAGVAKDIYIKSNLASAGVVSDDTLVNWGDTTAIVFEVQVDINGLCTFLIDNVDVSSVQTPAFSFAAGTILIPFYSLTLEAGDAGMEIRKWFSIADILSR